MQTTDIMRHTPGRSQEKGHLELRVVTSEKNTGLSAGSVPCRLTFPARMDLPRKTERTQDLDG